MAKSKTSKTNTSTNTNTSTSANETTANDPLLSAVARKARELGLAVDVTDESVSKALDAHKKRQVSALLLLADPNAARLRKAQALQKLDEASSADLLLRKARNRIKETIAKGEALANMSEVEVLRHNAARILINTMSKPPKAQPLAATGATETTTEVATETTTEAN